MIVEELLDKLRLLGLDKEIRVEFYDNDYDDYVEYSIRNICSYRGDYQDMAIVIDNSVKSVARDLYNEIIEAVQSKRVFYGYKGGEFRFDYSTRIWVVLDLSNCSDVYIDDIIKKDDIILIKTKK